MRSSNSSLSAPPFFTTKVRERGTGLGLSSAFSIVHSHAGFITVTSAPDAGATFAVYLPATENAAVVAVSTEPAPRGSGELILVVDDELMICRSLELVLKNSGYAVATACSGAEALAAFQQQGGKVRLVMTDLMMPTMSGAELIRALHAQDSTIPIIAFTGVINPEVRAELEAVGVACILMKPCAPQEILGAISQQLSGTK